MCTIVFGSCGGILESDTRPRFYRSQGTHKRHKRLVLTMKISPAAQNSIDCGKFFRKYQIYLGVDERCPILWPVDYLVYIVQGPILQVKLTEVHNHHIDGVNGEAINLELFRKRLSGSRRLCCTETEIRQSRMTHLHPQVPFGQDLF